MSALARPAVVFPDVEAWAVAYLRDALATRSEPVAAGVKVTAAWPEGAIPARLVSVRDDGGPRSGPTTKTTSVAVNVWAATQMDCAGLARLVAGLLEAAVGVGPVVAHAGSSGPVRMAEESGRPHRYLTADLVVRGADLET